MWADSEGFRFTRLTEDQVLVDFDHDSARNPFNWTLGSNQNDGLWVLKLTSSHLRQLGKENVHRSHSALPSAQLRDIVLFTQQCRSSDDARIQCYR